MPSRDTFGQKVTRYKEGLYVGYRYYDTAGVPVRYPFGYGLSYTRFAYSDLTVENRTVRVAVTNIGDCPGAEVAQLYIAPPRTGPSRPARQAPAGTPGRFSSTARGWVKLPPSPMNSSTVG